MRDLPVPLGKVRGRLTRLLPSHPRRKVGWKAFVLAALAILALSFSTIFGKAELVLSDTLMRAWQGGINSRPLDARIRLISLDDSTRAQGWTDRKTLQVLQRLDQAGAASIVICGEELFLQGPPLESTLPSSVRLLRDNSAVALLDPGKTGAEDLDGLLRAFPTTHPGFALVQDLCRAAGGRPWAPSDGRFEIAYKKAYDKTARGGKDFGGNYLAFQSLASLDQVLADPESAGRYRGTVVLMGRATIEAGARQIKTPIGSVQPPLVYACAANTMLEGWSLRSLNGASGLLLTLPVMLTLCLGLSGRSPTTIFVVGTAVLSGLVVLSFALFPLGIGLPMAQLLLGNALALGCLTALEFQRARRALAAFGGAEDASLSGRETRATIVFSELPRYLLDLERNQHVELLARRRDYNALLERVARKYHGQVLDYQGDAQMIGFGLRHEEDDEHSLEATAAALELVHSVPSLGAVWKVPEAELVVHAGVCTGTVALGHVGAVQKQDVAAIGDTTNTAARLMGAAMKLGLPVVVAETTYAASGGRLVGEPLPPVELKGKSAPVAVYAVKEVDSSWRERNLARHKERIPSGGTLTYRGRGRSDLGVTLALSALAFLLVSLLGQLQVAFPAENALYDAMQRGLALTPGDSRIVIVGIDGETCSPDRLGPFPWTRDVYARLLENLRDTGYQGIFFDITFKQPRADAPEGDQQLAEELFREPRAKVGVALYDNDGRYEDPLLFLADADRERLRTNHQLGLIHKREDNDSTLRWAVLAAEETGSPVGQRRLYPTGAMALRLEPGEPFEVTPQGLQAGDEILPSTLSKDFPHELLLNWGPPTTLGAIPQPGSYRYVSLWRLLEREDPVLRELRGAYLFVGDTFAGGERDAIDRVDTPVGSVKGVEAHARTLDTLLNGTHFRKASPAVMWAWELLLAGLTTLVLARYRGWRDYTPRLLALSLVHGAVYLWAFKTLRLWMELIHPLMVIGAICAAVMLGRYLLTLRALSRFVPSEVAAEILFYHQARDRRMVATVLLTDIRGYTTLSEGRSAVAMLDILNEYHRRTVACYERHGGQALTYQGDAQIVVFGVFGRRSFPVRDAVAAALELQAICAQLRQEWGISNPDDFDVGAGLCTGEVEVGFLGGSDNLQYSVVGETVRKSHKVQSMSTELAAPVILDEETFLAGGEKLRCDDLGAITVKGLEGPARLYRAVGVVDD